MTTLKERLASKRRRTDSVPVQVSDPGPAQERFDNADQRLRLLQVIPSTDPEHEARVAEAQNERDAAREELREHFVEVEFVAATPDDAERVLGAHTNDQGNWSIEALPELAALCAVDEELQDADWWTEQISSGTWSSGEKQALWSRLLTLNVALPPEHLPKG